MHPVVFLVTEKPVCSGTRSVLWYQLTHFDLLVDVIKHGTEQDPSSLGELSFKLSEPKICFENILLTLDIPADGGIDTLLRAGDANLAKRQCKLANGSDCLHRRGIEQ
jgi:hypothetical protein